MSEGFYETEVQCMVLESLKGLENIMIKFFLSAMKPLHVWWLINC